MDNQNWEARKAEIERLYLEKDQTLKDVREALAKRGFHKTYSISHLFLNVSLYHQARKASTRQDSNNGD